ncbi:MAG: hypothetical protein HYT97_08900 [Elusimicrobia bacterium]|nr:hypothetical protein [Elusimicrobiota bacterium]
MSHTKHANTIKKLSLTQTEYQVTIGSVLGDGTLSKAGKNYRLRLEHQSAHHDYIEWKYHHLSRLCMTKPKYVKQHNSYRVGTVGHPELTELRSKFYTNDGIKQIPKVFLDCLSPMSIAIWFMDDGYRIHKTVGIAVHSFSLEDVEFLKYIMKKYEIACNIQYDGHGPRLYIKTESYGIFKKLVKPHVIQVPCMAYKLV